MPTTQYATWLNIHPGTTSARDTVTTALGDYAADHDVAAITDWYTSTIQDRLPGGVDLVAGEQYVADVAVAATLTHEQLLACDPDHDEFWATVSQHALTGARGDEG